ncbi:hypothetical protein DdX_19472 [Ditylenchus destructor]|uniref:Uncharacterized protein n=1 Tax=Ditylenchus destructor TaxID=166010 RepID=A0AAD4MJC8_9BILA|nr:hypothetical protein DdX_19472 [Ditylenchus destructor]
MSAVDWYTTCLGVDDCLMPEKHITGTWPYDFRPIFHGFVQDQKQLERAPRAIEPGSEYSDKWTNLSGLNGEFTVV